MGCGVESVRPWLTQADIDGGKLGEAPGNELPDNGAPIVRMLVFSAPQGVKRIVPTGIDLDNREPYFWLAPGYSPGSFGISFYVRSSRSTLSPAIPGDPWPEN